MAECRNQECRQGYTPGVVASGKGTANAPVLGAAMRWGWVNCLACNMTESQKKAGAQFKYVTRSSPEIQERARLADAKAAYVPAAPKGPDLAAIAAKTPAPSASPSTIQPDIATRLLAQNEKLSNQISELWKKTGYYGVDWINCKTDEYLRDKKDTLRFARKFARRG